MTRPYLTFLCLLLVVGTGISAQDSGSQEPIGDESLNSRDETLYTFPESSPESQDDQELTSDPGPLISTWDFLRMILILAIVIGLIYGLFFVLKKTTLKRVVENDLIRVLGSRSLASNKSLHLVEVGNSIFLVGSADGGISMISEIKDSESLDRIHLQASELRTSEKRSFRDVLYEIFKPQESAGSGQSFDFVKDQKERIRKLR